MWYIYIYILVWRFGWAHCLRYRLYICIFLCTVFFFHSVSTTKDSKRCVLTWGKKSLLSSLSKKKTQSINGDSLELTRDICTDRTFFKIKLVEEWAIESLIRSFPRWNDNAAPPKKYNRVLWKKKKKSPRCLISSISRSWGESPTSISICISIKIIKDSSHLVI